MALPAKGVSKRRPVVAPQMHHSHCPRLFGSPVATSTLPAVFVEIEVLWGRSGGGVSIDPPPLVYKRSLCLAQSVRPIAPSLFSSSAQVQCNS